ncbi:MAG: aspartyl-phosphate phosphatase Spo0E family protein [Syntrophomonas sp.]
MARSRSEIIREIEQLRNDLENAVQMKNSLNASEALEISQALDEVINEFYRHHRDNQGVKKQCHQAALP